MQVNWMATAETNIYTRMTYVQVEFSRGKNMFRSALFLTALVTIIPTAAALADEAPQEVRHELMEDVGGAAKNIGKMLKGEAPFDAALANESLRTWADASATFGDLFPAGSESGYDTEAKASIWTDRAGFDEQLALFAEKANAAVAANPQSLDELKPAAGAVFKTCKSCHESYRVDD
jgi:cytochrome c556